MKILSSRRFGLWWRLAMDWLDGKFQSVIDALPQEASEAEVDAIFNEESES